MTDTIAALDAEILTLQQQAAAVAAAPPSFDEAWPATEQALLDAEDIFKRSGPQLGSAMAFPEAAYRRHQAAIGAAVTANKRAVFDSQRARVTAATEGGISAADKRQQVAGLERAIKRAAARRELLIRATECEFEFKPRPPLHREFAVFPRVALEELAS